MYFGGFAEKPTSFDVVAERDVVRFRMPLLIKEHSEVIRLRVDDVVPENAK